MNNNYNDITDKLGQPIWYDVLGFPRYCDFHPDKTHNIYADIVIFYEIRCQGCGKKFKVAMSVSRSDLWSNNMFKSFIDRESKLQKGDTSGQALEFFKQLPIESLNAAIHYGDPPNHTRRENSCVGNTMNVYDDRIIEFWVRSKSDWKRVPELEKELPDNNE